MTSPAKVFNSIKTKLFKTYSGDAGKMLLHTGTLAWVFSAAAQVFGIITNKKVSKDQKKFLIPQEIADAAINILSFYLITNSLQKYTKWLVSSGKIITPKIAKFCEEHGISLAKGTDGKAPNIGKAILNKVDTLTTTLKTNKSEKMEKEIQVLNDFFDKEYDPFESGLRIAGNVVGGVISSNIITPLLRNPIAAIHQKHSIAQEKLNADNYKSRTNMSSANIKI